MGVQLEGQILPQFLTLDVVLGILGNAVALWIFCFKLKSWNPNTIFLFNLVIADFMALVSLPLRIDALIRTYWAFGDGLCRINLFLMFTNRSASIAMMTVVALYRYFKVVHPHHRFNRLTRFHAVLVSLLVWILVMAPRVPMLALSHIKVLQNQTQCFFFTSYKEKSQAIVVMVGIHRGLTVLEFLVPFAMLLYCSVRISLFLRGRRVGNPEKVRKAMRVCIGIVVVFLVCFLPTSVTTAGIWIVVRYRPWDCAAFYSFTQLTIVSLGLNFLNSALDPVLYVFSSSMFRKALCESVPRCLRCGTRAGPVPDQSGSTESQSTTQQELKSIKTRLATDQEDSEVDQS